MIASSLVFGDYPHHAGDHLLIWSNLTTPGVVNSYPNPARLVTEVIFVGESSVPIGSASVP
jgi:hypothetical protein